ncbi:MAG: sugar ABC transporter substrate-binding protein [Candidatus Sumerlaeia bacterium]|nr:sugar ABC transporter substrate-binding protein [Candidatus Sumerlaeia bacterium]
MLKNLSIPTLLVIATLVLASCLGPPPRKETTDDGRKLITFLTMQLRPTFDDFINGLIAEFEAENPDVRILWIDSPAGEYETKLMTSFLANRSPDVINLPSDSMLEYVEKGLLHPMDDHLTEEQIAAYVPGLLYDSGRYDGQLYSVPWYASSAVLFINNAIIEEAGLTPDDVPTMVHELPDFMRIIREETGKFGYFPIYTEAGSMKNFFWTAGVPLLNEARTAAAFNTPRGVEVMRFWTDLYRQGLVPREAVSATHRRPIEMYKTGQLAILETGPQFMGQIENDSPDVYKNTTIAPLLRFPDSEQYLVALFVLAVSSQTVHPHEATQFAAHITNAANQLAFSKQVTILPSTIASLEDPYFTDPDDSFGGQARAISGVQMQKSTVLRPVPNANILFKMLDDVTEAVALGRMEADEALKIAEERWNVILD